MCGRVAQLDVHRRTPMVAVVTALVMATLLAVGALPTDDPRRRGPRNASTATSLEDEYASALYDEDADGDVDEYASSGERDADDGDKQVRDDAFQLRRGRHVHRVHDRAQNVADKAPPPLYHGAPFMDPAVILEPQQDSDGAEGSCPPAPPRRWSSPCSAPRCASDDDCARQQPGRRCCFDGCTTTCLTTTANPPLVVDWEEETPDALHPDSVVGLMLPAPRVAAPAAPSRTQRSHGEVAVLMGGCTLTPAESRRLEDFKRGGHVRKCFCSDGAVVCQLEPPPR